MGDALNACCEVARGELKQWFEKHYSAKWNFPTSWPIVAWAHDGRKWEGGDIEEDNCDELLERINDYVREVKSVMRQYGYSSANTFPILEELEMIRDNWEECKEADSEIKRKIKGE